MQRIDDMSNSLSAPSTSETTGAIKNQRKSTRKPLCGLADKPSWQSRVSSRGANLSRLFSDLLGLEISEGALVNMLDDSMLAFARQASLIRDRLLAGTIL